MKKILLIEDDPILQRTLRRLLESAMEASVTVVGDAMTAIMTLHAADVTFGCFHFDHIVSDYNLHGGSTGAEVLAWINERPNTYNADDNGAYKTPRQVYLERFTFLTDSDEAKALHNRFVRKPCGGRTLIQALETQGPIVVED